MAVYEVANCQLSHVFLSIFLFLISRRYLAEILGKDRKYTRLRRSGPFKFVFCLNNVLIFILDWNYLLYLFILIIYFINYTGVNF